MTRTLRRLARIQRIHEDEARNRLVRAQRAEEEHRAALEHCHQVLNEALLDEPQTADERMRRHSYSLRLEMRRRRLEHEAEHLVSEVEDRHGQLVDAIKQVKTTERFTDFLEAKQEQAVERRGQRELDEAGLLAWARSNGGGA